MHMPSAVCRLCVRHESVHFTAPGRFCNHQLLLHGIMAVTSSRNHPHRHLRHGWRENTVRSLLHHCIILCHQLCLTIIPLLLEFRGLCRHIFHCLLLVVVCNHDGGALFLRSLLHDDCFP